MHHQCICVINKIIETESSGSDDIFAPIFMSLVFITIILLVLIITMIKSKRVNMIDFRQKYEEEGRCLISIVKLTNILKILMSVEGYFDDVLVKSIPPDDGWPLGNPFGSAR